MKIHKYVLSVAFIAMFSLSAVSQKGNDTISTKTTIKKEGKVETDKSKRTITTNKPNSSKSSGKKQEIAKPNKSVTKDQQKKEPITKVTPDVEISPETIKAINFVLCRLSAEYNEGMGSFCKDRNCDLTTNHTGEYVDKYNKEFEKCIQLHEPDLHSNEDKVNYLTKTLFEHITVDEIKNLGEDKSKLDQIRTDLLTLLNPPTTTESQEAISCETHKSEIIDLKNKIEEQDSDLWIWYSLLGASVIANIVLLKRFLSKKRELIKSNSNLDEEKSKNSESKPSTRSTYNGNEDRLKSEINNLKNDIANKDKTINGLTTELKTFNKKSSELISQSKIQILYFEGFNKANELKIYEAKNLFTEGDSIYKVECNNGEYTYSVCEENNTFKRVKDTISGSIEAFCINDNSFNNHSKIRTITSGTLTEANGILTISTKAKIRYE